MANTSIRLKTKGLTILLKPSGNDGTFCPFYEDGRMAIGLISHLRDDSQWIARMLLAEHGYEINGLIESDVSPRLVDRIKKTETL